MGGGVPHRLEVEHMHGRAVDPRGLRQPDPAAADHARPVRRRPRIMGEAGQDQRPRLSGAERRHRDPVGKEPRRLGPALSRPPGGADAGNEGFGQVRGHGAVSAVIR